MNAPKRLAIVLAVVLLVGIAACARRVDGALLIGGRRNSTTQAHVLRIVTPQDFVTLNPHLYAATSLSMLSELTMAYFVRYDHRGHPYPELVTEIPSQENGGISADGRTITWHLRRGVRWSDAAPFSSEDVVFTVRVIQNSNNREIGRDGWDLIDRVDAHGPDIVVFHLRKPYSAFLPTFFGSAGANPCVLPRHLLWHFHSINDAAYNSMPVGIGPFHYVRWKRGEVVVLEANPFYFRGRPKLDRIEFRTVPNESTAYTEMQSGEADLWPLVRPGFYPRARSIPNTITQIIPGSYFSHMDFNLAHPVTNDLAVRQALRLGLDRARIREDVRHGTGTLQEGYAAPGSVGYDASVPFTKFDPAAAKALLDHNHWVPGPDGVRMRDGRRLSLDIAVAAGNPDTETLVEEIRDMWHVLGVEVSVHFYPTTLLFDSLEHGGILASGRYDVSEFAWQGDVMGDLSGLYTCDAVPPKGQNYLHYCSRSIDDLYSQMKETYDGGKRKPLLAQVQRTLASDVPTIVLAINDDIYVANSDLHNFHPNTYSPFDDMMDVDI